LIIAEAICLRYCHFRHYASIRRYFWPFLSLSADIPRADYLAHYAASFLRFICFALSTPIALPPTPFRRRASLPLIFADAAAPPPLRRACRHAGLPPCRRRRRHAARACLMPRAAMPAALMPLPYAEPDTPSDTAYADARAG
jgi:hypothetical protein